MNNATPINKKDFFEKQEKDTKERIEKLNQFDTDFLKKTHKLLLELKRSGVGLYKIKENEIRGLSNEDVTSIYFYINPLYQTKNLEEVRLDRYLLKKEKTGKIKIKVDGDIMSFPVFFLTGLENDSGAYMERTFMVGPQFELALSEIEEVLKKQNRYITLVDDEFFYNNSPISINKDTELYDLIRCVYIYFKGKDGEIQLTDLFEELKKIESKRFKNKTKDELIKKIRQELCSNSMGFGKKTKMTKLSTHRVFKIEKAKKLIFKNEKISE